jgi:hypothetical protein
VRTPTTDLGAGVDESAYPRSDICVPDHSILDAGPQRGSMNRAAPGTGWRSIGHSLLGNEKRLSQK